MIAPPPDPVISVVIPTLQRREKLLRVLGRLEEQSTPMGSFEVLLVEDAAEHDAEAIASVVGERPYELRLLSGERPGASSARNVGARAAGAPLLLFLDDDVLPRPELIAEHLAWHERHPQAEVGVLGLVEWADEITVTPFMRWLERGIQFDFKAIEGADAGWGRFYTANVSLKRSIFEAVDGFDEVRLPFGYEDLDLGLRLSKHGFRLLFNRDARAEHVHEMDLEMWKRRVRRIARAEHRFVELHPEQKPYFYELFSDAAAAPRARARWLPYADLISPATPWLGARVSGSLGAYYRQSLALPFLEEWRALTTPAPSGRSSRP